MKLPVIVGYGGVNAAGRSSDDIAYLRTVFEALDSATAEKTVIALASMMGLVSHSDSGSIVDSYGKTLTRSEAFQLAKDSVLAGTHIRRIENFDFDPERIQYNQPLSISSENKKCLFSAKPASGQNSIPDGWKQVGADGNNIIIEAPSDAIIQAPVFRPLGISAAGMLPSGFSPKSQYRCKQHPKGLQMTVYAASDAIHSVGIPLEEMMNLVPHDKIGVYASSSLGQIDELGMGGYQQSALLGSNPSSKNMPFGMPQMPADFVNAYILGSMGRTAGIIGACASFLYNLQSAVEDIKSGLCRIAFVGNAEAPINPAVIKAFQVMGAMSEDKNLAELDGLSDTKHINWRRACRPFADNRGFVMGESAQFCILFDDELAVSSGASVYGSIPDVFVHADGFKGSITKPGCGNYITFAKAAATAAAVAGQKTMKDGVVVYAHGTGTPQNRVTESDIMSRTAKAFGATKWQVAAIKCFLGHPLGPAAGDQLSHLLGFWRHNILPGIKTIDALANDVSQEHLQFNLDHVSVPENSFPAALINSKGFGGNNATATVISPQSTIEMLKSKHSKSSISNYHKLNEAVVEQTCQNYELITQKKLLPIYNAVAKNIDGEDINIEKNRLKIAGHADLELPSKNPFLVD